MAYLLGTLLIYRHSLFLGFDSDAFVLFEQARSGLLSVLHWDGTRHYIPVTALWTFLQYLVFGVNQDAYQILNILQHGVISFLVYLLARQLGLGRFCAFVAGTLFLSAGSAYQVVLWSIVGNNYFVSCFFYLLALRLFLRHLQSGSTKPAWTTSVLFAGAIFSHEQSASLYPLCLVASLLFDQLGGIAAWTRHTFKRSFHRTLLRVWPLTIPLVVFLLTKCWMTLQLQKDMLRGPTDVNTLVVALGQGILRCVSFNTSQLHIAGLTEQIRNSGRIPLWTAILLSALFLLCLRLKSRNQFLFLWITGHLLMMEMAVGITARYLYLPTAAASILVVGVLSRWTLRESQHRNKSKLQVFPLIFSTLLIGSLFLLSLSDLQEAQVEWAQADRMIRGLEKELSTISGAQPPIARIIILNAPSVLPSPLPGIYAFKNGTRSLVDLATPNTFSTVVLAHTPSNVNNANGSILMTMPEVTQLLTHRDTAVLRLDGATRQITRLSRVDLQTQSLSRDARVIIADPGSRPKLGWNWGRKRPVLTILPSGQVETFLAPVTSDKGWFIISWLNAREREFELRVGNSPPKKIMSDNSGQWETHLDELPSLKIEESKTRITLRNTGKLQLRLSRFGFFQPRALLNSETTPEFLWDQTNILNLPATSELRIPIPYDRKYGHQHRLLEIIYLGEKKRQIRVQLPSGQQIELRTPPSARLPWITAAARLPDTDSVLLKAVGPKSARIRQLWFPNTDNIDGDRENR